MSLASFLGSYHYTRGNTEKALVWLKRAYQQGKPKDGIVYGYILLRSGRLEEAESLFQKLRRVTMGTAEEIQLRQNLALVLWKKGQLEEAIARLEKLAEEHPVTSVRGCLGYLYIERGDLDRALAYNLEAFEYNPKNGVIRDNLGQTYVELGQYEKAVGLYAPMMKEQPPPTFPECYYHYGLALEGMGRLEEALAEFAKARGKRFSGLSAISPAVIEARMAAIETRGRDTVDFPQA